MCTRTRNRKRGEEERPLLQSSVSAPIRPFEFAAKVGEGRRTRSSQETLNLFIRQILKCILTQEI